MPRSYYGLRRGGRVDVFRWDSTLSPILQRLPMRYDLRNHSPSGPEWGYSGSGPAQLALALLADALGDDGRAQAHYQAYKREVIAGLQRHSWVLDREEIVAWVRDQESTDRMPFPPANEPDTQPAQEI